MRRTFFKLKTCNEFEVDKGVRGSLDVSKIHFVSEILTSKYGFWFFIHCENGKYENCFKTKEQAEESRKRLFELMDAQVYE
jgi:hypothetical protein